MMKSPMTPLGAVAAAIACTCASLGAVSPAFGESATNGVYGGTIGSSAWFASMRASAANQAVIRSLSGRSGAGRLPADTVEVAGRIVCPGGNPFPKGRFPDLRIRCRNEQVDSVERAPFVNDDGSFYTVFKKGATYDLYWMGYFGGLEKFASVTVAPNGPSQRTFVFEYRVGAEPPGEETPSAPRQEPAPVATPPERDLPPASEPGTPAEKETDLRQPARPVPDFAEQRLLEAIRYGTTIAEKLSLLERLARYYREQDGQVSTQPVDPVRYPSPRPMPRQEPSPSPYPVGTPTTDVAKGPNPSPAPPAVNVNSFDLAGFPAAPTTFEEQLVLDAIRSATTPQFKADAHEKLARYYERKGDTARAQTERSKAQYWRDSAR